MQIPFFCFHDTDLAPEGSSLRETFRNVDQIVQIIKDLMSQTGKKLLWAHRTCSTIPGLCTEPPPHRAHRRLRMPPLESRGRSRSHMSSEAKLRVLGRQEGYETLLNTDMKLELDNFARFLHMAVDYAKEIGFKGQFLIEPKPKEPTKHQHDFDSASVIGSCEHTVWRSISSST